MLQTYQALFFDLDDTLLDFGIGMETSLEELHAHFGIDYALEEYKSLFKQINDNVWKQVHEGTLYSRDVNSTRFGRLVELLCLKQNPKELADVYEELLGREAHWLTGAKETLFHLKERHKIGIITNGLKKVQKKKFELMGIEEFCSCFIISEEVGFAKPNKAIFALALEKLGVLPSEALMVGDKLESDYQGALNAGLDFCWVNPQKLEIPSSYPSPRYNVSSVSELRS